MNQDDVRRRAYQKYLKRVRMGLQPQNEVEAKLLQDEDYEEAEWELIEEQERKKQSRPLL